MFIIKTPNTSARFLYTDLAIFLNKVSGAFSVFIFKFQMKIAINNTGKDMIWKTTFVPYVWYIVPPNVEPRTLPSALEVQQEP
jgi:hypothetical protein